MNSCPPTPGLTVITNTRSSSSMTSFRVCTGSCEKIENRLLPALSVRRGTAVPRARATQVERALRARFHLWTRRRDGSGWPNSIFSQLQGNGGQLSCSGDEEFRPCILRSSTSQEWRNPGHWRERPRSSLRQFWRTRIVRNPCMKYLVWQPICIHMVGHRN